MACAASPRLLPILLLTFLPGCVNDHPVSIFKGDPIPPEDTAPTVEIISPATGTVFLGGDGIDFRAEVFDAEEALDTLTLAWSSDLDGPLGAGAIAGTGSVTLEGVSPSAGVHTISLVVTDSTDLVGEDIVLVEVDAPPTAPEITLGPANPRTTDDLVATVVTPSTDPEGEPVSYTWAWSVDGAASTASDTETLPATATARDQSWTVTLTPFAGPAEGPAATATVTIENSAPSASGVVIDPSLPVAGGSLTCLADPPATDADADPLSYTIAWTRDGVVHTDTDTTIEPGDTIPTGITARDETWTCTVTPSDDALEGPPASAAVTINYEPLASTVSADDAAAVFTGGGWASSYYQALATRGDFDYDGDGRADILIGSTVYDTAYTDPGGAFLFLGPVSGELALDSTADAALVFSPASALAYAGSEVSAGDVDGDGLDELLVSAVGADIVYLLDDGLTGSVDDSTTGVTALAGYRYGTVVGDINDDGFADLLLARSFGTSATVYWGDPTGPSDSGETISVLGTDMVGGAVAVVSGGVDLDGDGIHEWAAVGSGAIVTIRSGMNTMTELDDMTNYTAAVTIVHLAEDLDGDGYGDALVANYSQAYDDGFTGPVSDFGMIWAFPGGASGVTATGEADAAWTLRGSADHAYVGFDLDTTDVDGDGTTDLLVGRYRNDPVLFFGPQSTGSRDETDADVRFEDAIDAVARAGDVNGDGFGDVLVGSTEPGTGPYLHPGGPR